MKKFTILVVSLLMSLALFAQGKYSQKDIGKIICKDGTLITLDKFKISKLNLEPVAIVYDVSDDGSFFYGMGVETEEMIFSTVKYYDCDSGLEGLTNGEKALETIKKTYPKKSADLKTNFPAFYYASVYGEKYELGKYSDGWFIPTESEFPNAYGDASKTWMYFNPSYDYFPSYTWRSNAKIYKNTYDSWDGWLVDDIPHNIFFSTNRRGLGLERGGFYEDSNSKKGHVIVFRKFN